MYFVCECGLCFKAKQDFTLGNGHLCHCKRILNYAFMVFLGLRGIALSTVFVYAISFIYLRVMLGRVLGEEESAVSDGPRMIVTSPEFG